LSSNGEAECAPGTEPTNREVGRAQGVEPPELVADPKSDPGVDATNVTSAEKVESEANPEPKVEYAAAPAAAAAADAADAVSDAPAAAPTSTLETTFTWSRKPPLSCSGTDAACVQSVQFDTSPHLPNFPSEELRRGDVDPEADENVVAAASASPSATCSGEPTLVRALVLPTTEGPPSWTRDDESWLLVDSSRSSDEEKEGGACDDESTSGGANRDPSPASQRQSSTDASDVTISLTSNDSSSSTPARFGSSRSPYPDQHR
jgi:hypothetical protein